MVKKLEHLKVAEIRAELNNRGEDSKGRKEVSNFYVPFLWHRFSFRRNIPFLLKNLKRKAEIKQRLSDWLEDNDFDPDYYDFVSQSEILPDSEIPGLESVPEEKISEKHRRKPQSADKMSPKASAEIKSNSISAKTSQVPSRKKRGDLNKQFVKY
jgi:hypothetical protein